MTQIQIIGLLMYRTNMRVEHWAKNKGFTKSTVYRVVSRAMKKGPVTDKVREEIAQSIKKPVSEVFTDAE